MFRRLVLLAAPLALLGLVTLTTGCEEDARCREACEHTCDICDSGCSDQELDTCEQSCVDGLTAPERTDCVIQATSCDDLWKC